MGDSDTGAAERKRRHTNGEQHERQLRTVSLVLLSVLVGVMGGLGAVFFRDLIAFFHNLLFLGKLSIVYDANVHTPASYLGPFVILVPVFGAVGVVFLVKNFAPEAKGRGVGEVMDAVYYAKGKIRPIVAIIKPLASALSIGSGGSLGREGPIIQIGSSIGSAIGQILTMPAWQRITLIAAGGGAGVAATFNTPVGGVLFALEIVVNEISFRTIVPIIVATATGTYIGRLFFGDHPSFVIPAFETPYFEVTRPLTLFLYIGLGLLGGLLSILFIKFIYWMEDFFEMRIKRSYYIRHMAGMALVGVMMYLVLVYSGHYYIAGVGYATVRDILTGTLLNPYLLLALLVLKLAATGLTLGSGASGGIFSPCLFIGAALGGLYGVVLRRLFPSLAITPSAFAVAGMAAIVGGSTGAVMTAIVMIFEMTLDYTIMMPLAIAVAISFGVRKMVSRESIYTLKLVRKGRNIPDAFRKNIQDWLRADQMMEKSVRVITPSSRLSEIARLGGEEGQIPYFILQDNSDIVGVIQKDAVFGSRGDSGKDMPVSEMITPGIINKSFVIVEGRTLYQDVLKEMYLRKASIAVVVDHLGNARAKQVIGVITQEMIIDLAEYNAELFADMPGQVRSTSRPPD
jgi:CIC family chloride channel protein